MKRVILGAVALLAMGACSRGPTADVRQESAELTVNNVEATIAIFTDWGSGYCADVEIENHTSADIENWEVELALPNSYNVYAWNGTLQGTTVSADSHNSIVAPGQSTTFGYCANTNAPNYQPSVVSIEYLGGGGGEPTCDPGGNTVPAPTTEPTERAEVDGYYIEPSHFIVQPGTQGWRYTTNQPPANWADDSFADGAWSFGTAGFFHGQGMPGDHQGTAWPASGSCSDDTPCNLWLRTTITLDQCDIDNLMLWGRWDDKMEVFVNGVPGINEPGWTPGYRYTGLSGEARTALRVGENTIAVHLIDVGVDRYFDLVPVRHGALLQRPMAGTASPTPALQEYSDAFERFMIEHGVPAGTLAVMKNDQVVLNRSFGWKTKHFQTPLEADAVMRLASVDKPITLAAIRRILDEGMTDPVTNQVITENTQVFPLLAAHGLTPPPGAQISAWTNQITVGHLINHQAGLPEPPADDTFYQTLGIAPGAEQPIDNVRWVYGEGPTFQPGHCPSSSCYSSSGYMVLRYLVSVLKGDLLGYLRSNEVLGAVGTSDVFIAHERLAGRESREPWYATLEAPYDRWLLLENYTALSASAEALVRFARGYSLNTGDAMIDADTGAWTPIPGGMVFSGGYFGTSSVILQDRNRQVTFAYIFNAMLNHDALIEELEQLNWQYDDTDYGL